MVEAERSLYLLWRQGRAFEELRRFRCTEFRNTAYAEGLVVVTLDDVAAESCRALGSAVAVRGPPAALSSTVQRCVLAACMIEPCGEGSSLASAVAHIKSTCSVAKLAKTRVEVHGVNPKAASQVRQRFQALGVGNETADAESAPLWIIQEAARVRLGWQVAVGGTSAKNAMNGVKQRFAQAPTSMGARDAVLTANIAAVPHGGCVLDPCAGAGALLQAAAMLTDSCAIGFDVDGDALCSAYQTFQSASLPAPMLLQTDATRPPIDAARAAVDAIVCDVPYGVRAPILGQAVQHDDAVDWVDILSGIFRFALHALAGGGFCVVWVPDLDVNSDEHDSLELKLRSALRANDVHFMLERILREDRKGGVQRALAVFRSKAPPSPVVPVRCRWQRTERQKKSLVQVNSQMKEMAFAQMQRGLSYTKAKKQGGGQADIWRAAWAGDIEAVTNYIASGRPVDATDPASGRTVLQLAAGYGRAAICKLLLQAGAHPGSFSGACAAHRAARFGHAEALAELVAEEHPSAQVARLAAGQPDADGRTALNLASSFGHCSCVTILLAAGDKCHVIEAATMLASSTGMAALHCAARYGHEDILQALLSAGCDHRQPSQDGALALHLAARWGHPGAVRLLLAIDPATADLPGAGGRTALEEARLWSRDPCVDVLAL